jgi:ketosteroid isomerase-like protein
MTQRSDDLQYLKDRAAIQDVLARYFSGLDRCNKEQVRSCFTDDIHAHYDHRGTTKGIEALMDGFQTFKRMAEGRMKVTTHFMGNLQVKSIEGDVAETETNAIAFLVAPGKGEGEIAMRSLRYIDRLRREKDGWRISDRVHTLDWSCELPANFAVTLAQRLSALPPRS